MVVLTKPVATAAAVVVAAAAETVVIPVIDLSHPDAMNLLVKACEDPGFFKVVGHGVPLEIISRLETEAKNFFALPLFQKEKATATIPDPFGYGNKKIGPNGDVGWIEYLMMTTNPGFDYKIFESVFGENLESFRSAVSDYVRAVKRMACEILELVADGLKIEEREVLSKMLKNEESDSVFRLNHYPPPLPEEVKSGGKNDHELIGFGEHTDPQIISVLRSNNTCGLQICLRDGTWISVPPDHCCFFINVGDTLQVMTNGRFKSVRHRVVVANSKKSRVSMVYFGGPPLKEKIAPLPSLMKGGEEDSLYKEFTWFEYKRSAYKSRLADNRLCFFEKIPA